MKRKFRPLGLATVVFFFTMTFTSCWHPPFNADLSASEYTVSKLGSPVLAIFLNLPSEVSGAYYIPYRSPSEYNYGALVWKTTNQIKFAYLNITGPNLYTYINYGAIALNQMGPAAQITMPTGSNVGGNNIYCGASSGGIEQLVLTGFSPASWSPGDPAIGLGMVPDTSTTTNDWFSMAYFNGGQLNYVSSQINSVSSFPPSLTGFPFTYSVSIPVAPGFFAQSPVNSGYYLSAKMPNGKYETYYWSSITALPVRLPVNVQIMGILSDGRLLADSSSSVTVYSPMGDYLFTISTGALHFVHERYDSVNLCWISVFTRTVEIPQQNTDNNQYLIEIYEIKTLDLQNLAR